MAEFLVKVADERGHISETIESALSADELRNRYAHQGLFVYSIRNRGLFAGGVISIPHRRKLKMGQFVIFNQQFVTLIRAGLPIPSALDILVRQQQNEFFRSILEDIRKRIKTGELLSQAFAAQPVIPRIYTTTLLAGEKSGNLEEVLGRYITFQKVALSFRKKLVASLFYPALLIIGITVLIVFLITYVIPQFGLLYHDLHLELPPITEFLLNFGEIAKSYFLPALAAIIAIAVLLVRWKRSPKGSRRFDRWRLRLPLLGTIWLKYQIAMFSRTLATLLSGGLPLVPAMETAGDSMESRNVADGVVNAAQHVREGQSLSSSLKETKVFPELALEMIEVGESTGALPGMLNSVAEFYEEDVQNALSAALALIEPIILVVMGIVIGGILISLYLPIFSIGSSGAIR